MGIYARRKPLVVDYSWSHSAILRDKSRIVSSASKAATGRLSGKNKQTKKKTSRSLSNESRPETARLVLAKQEMERNYRDKPLLPIRASHFFQSFSFIHSFIIISYSIIHFSYFLLHFFSIYLDFLPVSVIIHKLHRRKIRVFGKYRFLLNPAHSKENIDMVFSVWLVFGMYTDSSEDDIFNKLLQFTPAASQDGCTDTVALLTPLHWDRMCCSHNLPRAELIFTEGARKERFSIHKVAGPH